eukprot:364709-Chlamydomonas_euryale.AAC.19
MPQVQTLSLIQPSSPATGCQTSVPRRCSGCVVCRGLPSPPRCARLRQSASGTGRSRSEPVAAPGAPGCSRRAATCPRRARCVLTCGSAPARAAAPRSPPVTCPPRSPAASPSPARGRQQRARRADAPRSRTTPRRLRPPQALRRPSMTLLTRLSVRPELYCCRVTQRPTTMRRRLAARQRPRCCRCCCC